MRCSGSLEAAPASSSACACAEHVELGPELARQLELEAGMQLRLVTGGGDLALFTLGGIAEGRASIRLGSGGRERLGVRIGDSLELEVRAVAGALGEEEARRRGELIEDSIIAANSRLIALAPHGGMIEEGTDFQAEWLAEKAGASLWVCKGWKQGGGAYQRWHIRSIDLHPRSFPKLSEHGARKYEYAVSFHGTQDPRLIIGGRAPRALKAQLARAISRATDGAVPLSIADPGDPFVASDPRNLVNRLAHHGVQLEQPLAARREHGLAIARAVHTVLLRWAPMPGGA